MIKILHRESTLIGDTKVDDGEVPEQAVVIESYVGTVNIVGWNGEQVLISKTMIDEVCKVLRMYKED